MSNLFKQPYVIHKSNEACIINSNRLVEERLRELNEAQMEEKARKKAASGEAEFTEGLVVGGIYTSDALVPEEEQQEPQVIKEDLLEEARAEAEKILADARAQADLILNDAGQQAKQIYESQKKAAYAEGMEQADEELNRQKADQAEEFAQLKRNHEQEYRLKLQSMEREIVEALIPVFDQVFHIQFEDKQDILLHLIDNTLMNIEAGKKFRICVSRENCRMVEEKLPYLQEQLGGAVSLEVVADGRMAGQECRIESDFGTFDCGLDMELKNLFKDIRSLSI